MSKNTEHDLGSQPVETILAKHNLTHHDVVAAIGSRVSLVNWTGCSSIQTTGNTGSYG